MQAQNNAIFLAPVHDVFIRLDSRQFDLVYVDPPFFTQIGDGFDFFNDERSLHGSFQEYLEYMVFVIYQSKRVLKDSGSILFRMDPASPFNSRLFLDRIFGKQNFRAEIIWERRVIGNRLSSPYLNYDSVFFYSKSDDYTYHALQNEEKIKSYSHYDEQGAYKLWPLTAPITRPNLNFSWRDRKPPKNSSWKYSLDKLEQLDREGKIDWSGKLPRRKVYLSEQSHDAARGFVWRNEFPQKRGSNKIDPRICDLVNMASNPGDIVLDSFTTEISSGSLGFSGRNWTGIASPIETKLSNKSKSYASQFFQVNNVEDMEIVDNNNLPLPVLRLIASEARALDNNTVLELSGQRFAFLVGVNHYRDGINNLRYCMNDVIDLEMVLKDVGYQVKVLHDDMEDNNLLPLRSNIDTELNNLAQSIGPDDTLFVHFSCHGTLIEDDAVLIVSDTRYQRMRNSGLLVSDIINTMKAGRARKLVLSLDVCHAGVNLGRAFMDQEFIRNVYENAEGFVLLAASTAHQQAYELPEFAHGVYSHYLINGLTGEADFDDDGRISVEDVRNYILDSVRRWNLGNNNRQEPTYRNEGIGEILLVSPRLD